MDRGPRVLIRIATILAISPSISSPSPLPHVLVDKSGLKQKGSSSRINVSRCFGCRSAATGARMGIGIAQQEGKGPYQKDTHKGEWVGFLCDSCGTSARRRAEMSLHPTTLDSLRTGPGRRAQTEDCDIVLLMLDELRCTHCNGTMPSPLASLPNFGVQEHNLPKSAPWIFPSPWFCAQHWQRRPGEESSVCAAPEWALVGGPRGGKAGGIPKKFPVDSSYDPGVDGGFWQHAGSLVPAGVGREVVGCEGGHGTDGFGAALLSDAVVGCGVEVETLQGGPGLNSVIRSSTVGEVEQRMKLTMLKHPRSTMCEHANCTVRPSFGEEGGASLRCFAHRVDGDVDTRNRLCASSDGCRRRATFGLRGRGGRRGNMYCARHRPAGYEDLANRRCGVDGCRKQVTFGPEVNGTRLRCWRHRREGDVDRKNWRRSFPQDALQ